MGIYLIISSIVIFSIGMIWLIRVENKNYYGFPYSFLFILLLAANVFITFHSVQITSLPPQDKYPLSSDIKLNIYDKDITTIYFKEYEQKDNFIIIKEYAKDQQFHMNNFIAWEKQDKPLTIQLLDNDNKFKYKDRETDTWYNIQESIAVQ